MHVQAQRVVVFDTFIGAGNTKGIIANVGNNSRGETSERSCNRHCNK